MPVIIVLFLFLIRRVRVNVVYDLRRKYFATKFEKLLTALRLDSIVCYQNKNYSVCINFLRIGKKSPKNYPAAL